MGHLINPTAFRLSYYKDWMDTWYVSTYTGYASVLHASKRSKRIMMYFLETSITDKFSVLYSHMLVCDANLRQLQVRMYFYDGFTEMRVQRLVYVIKNFNWRKNKFILNVCRRFRFLKGNTQRARRLTKWGYLTYALFRKAFFLMLLLIGYLKQDAAEETKLIIYKFFYDSFPKWWTFFGRFLTRVFDPDNKKWRKRFSLGRLKISFMRFEDKKKFNGLFVLHSFMEYAWNTLKYEILKEKTLSLQDIQGNFCVFLNLLEQTYFYCVSRYRAIVHLSFFHRFNLGAGACLYHIGLLKQTDHFVFAFAMWALRIYLAHFRQRLFFKIYYRIIKPLVMKQISLPISLEFFGIDNDAVCCQFVTRYLVRKIEMNFTIRELYNPISKDLQILVYEFGILIGFKMQFIGRITRRDRARKSWVLFGSVPFSTVSAYIEHATYIGILRNGTCCLRAWFHRAASVINYNYLYTYILTQNILRKTLLGRINNWFVAHTEDGQKKVYFARSNLPVV